ncbi:MAG: sigma-E processing peptidase SpoIIGA [Lachnospiraceae bacterium]|nr:sigma-E processing peptidase SpoIIGA [Lachnospiraceae bacterium]
MQYELYIDVFFLFNLWMNYLILEITNMFMKTSIARIKIALIAAAGAFGLCIIVLLPFGSLQMKSIIAEILYGIVTLRFGFHLKDKQFVKGFVCLYGSAVLLAGMIEFFIGKYSAWTIMIVGTMCAGIIYVAYKGYQYLFEREKYYYQVKVNCNSLSVEVKGLFDSGNTLCDPIGGNCVHIISEEAAHSINLANREEKIRLIPYQSVGKQNGLMTAYFADSIEIEKDGKIVEINSPLLGIYKGKLSELGEYEIILNSRVFLQEHNKGRKRYAV